MYGAMSFIVATVSSIHSPQWISGLPAYTSLAATWPTRYISSMWRRATKICHFFGYKYKKPAIHML